MGQQSLVNYLPPRLLKYTVELR